LSPAFRDVSSSKRCIELLSSPSDLHAQLKSHIYQ
jgi:hypothetical protein